MVSAKTPVICMSWLCLLLGLDVIAVAHYGGGCIYEPPCFRNLIACHSISIDFNFKKGCKKIRSRWFTHESTRFLKTPMWLQSILSSFLYCHRVLHHLPVYGRQIRGIRWEMRVIKIIRLLSWCRKPLCAHWRGCSRRSILPLWQKMKSIDLLYLKPLSWLSLRKSVSAANPHKRAREW